MTDEIQVIEPPEIEDKHFTGLDGVEYRLLFKQKMFCEYYLQFGGNGVDAVIEAGYEVNFKDKQGNDTGVPNRKLAAVIASENLVKPNICAYINLKLDEYGFNDDNVERQHRMLLNQNADLKSKAKAIEMYYKKRGAFKDETDKQNTQINFFIGESNLADTLTRYLQEHVPGSNPTVLESIDATTADGD